MYEESYANALRDKFPNPQLSAIKELMSFYCKKAKNFFSDLHHASTATSIVHCINNHLQNKSEAKNDDCINDIKLLINNAVNTDDFNTAGDFAHIHQCLKEKVPGFMTSLEFYPPKLKAPLKHSSTKLYSTIFTLESKTIDPHHRHHNHHHKHHHISDDQQHNNDHTSSDHHSSNHNDYNIHNHHSSHHNDYNSYHHHHSSDNSHYGHGSDYHSSSDHDYGGGHSP